MSDVEYTISQDEAEGRSARDEANYSLLTTNEVKHTIRSPRGNSHALSDYQMQLILLQQQNKKRLMMSRQQASRNATLNQFRNEPESVDASVENIHDTSILPISVPSSGRGSQESAARGTDSSDQSLSAVPKNGRVQAPQESLANVQGHQSSEVNPTRTDISMEQGSGCLIADPTSPIDECNQSSPRYMVLSRVICASHHKLCDQRIYRDVPHPVTFNDVYHIAGSSLVTDLIGLLEIQEDTLFIVYRDYHCDRTSSTSIPKLAKRQRTRYQREILSVVAEELQLAIQSLSKFAPDYRSYNMEPDDEFSDPDSISTFTTSPYEYSRKYLYHHRTEIHDKASAGPEDGPIVVLSQWLEANPDPMYDECDGLFSQGLISKSTLQWLFIPNSVVVSHERSTAIAYVLQDLLTEEFGLRLGCWNWGYDGNGLFRQPTDLTVGMPTYAVINITQLDTYPIEYAVGETKNAILKTGNRFWDFQGQKFMSYEGLDYTGQRFYPPESRMMIDYKTYYKFHPDSRAFSSSAKRKTPFDPWPQRIEGGTNLTASETLLLPPGIHGFFMQEKKWVHLLVNQIQPVNWNKSAFDRLVLPKPTKNLIKGLIMIRKPSIGISNIELDLQSRQGDIIAGKGNGLIMLLHGGPGTGKTLTAESVAELAEMPLYSVTCGDIGTSPAAVEQYLNSVLHLGKTWNCILLLDEADVFLEERSLSDLDRNSLVSVFLRTLEYYSGILILTSNRVGTFDEAFQSRIQLALYYAPLGPSSRMQIWHNFLDMIKTDYRNVHYSDIVAHIDDLSAYELNGRQIRNALTTARQLALYEGDILNWERLKTALEVNMHFQTYLRDVHGHTDEEWNRENRLR